MRLLKVIIASLGLAASTTDTAPQEQTDVGGWIVFRRAHRDQTWIVAIDRWIESTEADKCKSWAKIHFRQDSATTTLIHDEANAAMVDLEEDIERSIESVGGRRVGSQTGVDGRTTWFCAHDADLEEVISTQARKFTFAPVSVLRTDLLEARELLPDRMESQLAANKYILDELRQAGDSGSRPRQVMHVFVFDQNTQMKALRDHLTSLGYRIDETSADDGRRDVFHILVHSDVLLETVDRQVTQFNEICARYWCIYDGWETPVVND